MLPVSDTYSESSVIRYNMQPKAFSSSDGIFCPSQHLLLVCEMTSQAQFDVNHSICVNNHLPEK
jgi:hypothetical protein